MSDWYWTLGGGGVNGPDSTAALVELLRQRRLPIDFSVCRVGENEWRSVVSVTEFAAIVREVSAPPPSQVVNVFYAAPPKSRLVYVLLGLFLGGLGIHNFYAGYTGRAAIQLLVTLATGWLIAPICVIWIWNLIEILVTTSDANGRAFA